VTKILLEGHNLSQVCYAPTRSAVDLCTVKYDLGSERKCAGPWKGSVCGPREWKRHLGKGGIGSSERGQGASVDSGQRKRKDMIRGEMRRRREDKEDNPFTASRCQHAQSKSMCTAGRQKVNPLLMYIFVYLTILIVPGK
jgi:hypothetical protein